MLNLLCLLSFAQAGERTLPITATPRALFADDKDRFYIDRGGEVVRWTTLQDKVFTWPAPKEWSTSQLTHAIAPKTGTLHSLQEVSRSRCLDKECTKRVTDYQLFLWECDEGGRCDKDSLATWSRRSGDKNYTTHRAEHRVTEKGTLLLHEITTRVSEKEVKVDHDYRCGKKRCEAAAWEEQFFAEMDHPPTFRIDESSRQITGPGLPRARTEGVGLLEAMANVDTVMLYDRRGNPHVFWHQSNSRSFAHRYVDPAGPAVQVETVDSVESGASAAGVRLGPQGVLTFHYFFRNSYYKGVKATFWPQGEGEPAFQVDIASGRDDNPGWNLLAASTPQGRVLMGYTADPKGKGGYVLRLFDSVDDVKAAAKPEPEGWEKKHKKAFLLAGAGVAYVDWQLMSAPTEAGDLEGVEDPGRYQITSEYLLAPSLMGEATAEAKLGRLSFGASYARQAIKDGLSEAGLSEAEVNRLYGTIGVDRIIKYHDVRVQVRRGQMVGTYDLRPEQTEGSPVTARSGTIDQTYERMDVYLLNTWRVRYGILRQSERLTLPFYAYSIEEGETDYAFAGSFTSAATVTDTAFTLGYSRLDYAAKFENKVSRLFLDGDIGIGLSRADLDRSVEVGGWDGAPSETVSEVRTVFLPFNVETGYILMRRSYDLHGLGWWARAGLRAEGNVTGIVHKPGEREEAAEESSVTTTFSRMELRSGPFFNLGAVF